MPKGQCHCGAVRYEMSADTIYQAVCHCADCRRHTGAPMVAWALVRKDGLKVEGEIREYASSEHGRRQFCPQCGTSLFYLNATIFPDQVDVQVATLDDPGAMAPQIQVQVADRIGWVTGLKDVPEFERYPNSA